MMRKLYYNWEYLPPVHDGHCQNEDSHQWKGWVHGQKIVREAAKSLLARYESGQDGKRSRFRGSARRGHVA